MPLTCVTEREPLAWSVERTPVVCSTGRSLVVYRIERTPVVCGTERTLAVGPVEVRSKSPHENSAVRTPTVARTRGQVASIGFPHSEQKSDCHATVFTTRRSAPQWSHHASIERDVDSPTFRDGRTFSNRPEYSASEPDIQGPPNGG
jgi:hypothetical protein